MSFETNMRALLVGVEEYLDLGRKRPGTNNALREVMHRLEEGGWQVRLLSDDAHNSKQRAGLTQILEGIEWLRGADQCLIVLSGLIKDARFYPSDTKASFIAQSTLSLPDIIESLPSNVGMIIDGPVKSSLVNNLPWVLVSQEDESVQEQIFSAYGPSLFLHSITVALNIWPSHNALKVKDFFTFVKQQDAPKSIYHFYSSLDSMTLLTPCGKEPSSVILLTEPPPTQLHDTHSSDNIDPVIPHMSSSSSLSGDQRGGRFIAKGRFQLQRLLGEGGIGQVFLAKDTHLNKKRAVKLLKIPDTLTESQRTHIQGRMIQSARAAQELSEHSHHVVQVFDLGIDEGTEMPFMVMEYLEGITLHERLYQPPPLTLDQVFEITLTLCETLAIAHQKNVIHRDLKPDNIMLISRGETDLFVKLLDFDLVKVEEGEVKTQEGQILGTLEYMAPEQLKGMEIDARADVFALGAIIYECFSGVRANPGKTQRELVRLLLDYGPKPLEEVISHLPKEICNLINRCLSLDIDQRPKNAQELLHELRPLEKYKPSLSTMTFNLVDQEIEEMNTPNTLADTSTEGESNHSLEPIVAPRQEKTSESSLHSKGLSTNLSNNEYVKQSGLPPESTLIGSDSSSLFSSRATLILIAVLVTLIALLVSPWSVDRQQNLNRSSENDRGDQVEKNIPSALDKREHAPQLTSLGPLRLLPLPSPRWSDAVKSSSERAPLMGEARLFEGGRLEERLSRLLYELHFQSREGDPPRPEWESEAIRYHLFKRLDLSALRESPGKLYMPQILYIDHLTRRPKPETAPKLGSVLAFDEGLLLLSDPSDRSSNLSCRGLQQGDLISNIRWVVRGKRSLNGNCQGRSCLDAYHMSLKRKRSSKLKMTLTVQRAERTDGEWRSLKESIKCTL